MGDRGGDDDGDGAEPLETRFKPLDRRRIREIQKWLEGARPDAPTAAELEEFETWVALEIEWCLARHQPVRELVGFLNAARAQKGSTTER